MNRFEELLQETEGRFEERTEELKIHLHSSLNVGCRPEEIAEIIFQMAIYAGMPVVITALKTFRTVLQERGLWPLT